MNFLKRRSRDDARRHRTPARRPDLEGLEERRLLYSVNGGLWTKPERVTFSFMPDGTNVGGVPSSLYSTMNAVMSTATWQQDIEKAAATWEAAANINFSLVSDNGEAWGSNGDEQGDPNIGDIRIGAIPLASNLAAITYTPPPVNGDPTGGDIFFNSTLNWSPATGFDLMTVALHEMGHAVGLGESTDTAAVMYTYYSGIRQVLTSDDITGIDSPYGGLPSTPSNTVWTSATNMTPLIQSNGQAALGGQYLNSSAEALWYTATVPTSDTTGTMTVTMQSSALSLLSPREVVYEDSGGSLVGLGQSYAIDTYGATINYTVSGVTPGESFYFRVMPAQAGPGSVGAFGMEVNFGTQTQAPIAPPNTTVASTWDTNGGWSQMKTSNDVEILDAQSKHDRKETQTTKASNLSHANVSVHLTNHAGTVRVAQDHPSGPKHRR